MAIDSNLGAVVRAEEGAIEPIPGNEGRIAQAWVNVRGGLRVFSVYFWYSEAWTPRNEALLEAVMKRVKVSRYSWLVACDAEHVSRRIWKESLVPKGEDALWWPRKKRPRAGPKAQKVSGSKEPVIMLLRVTASGDIFTDEGGGRL